MTLLPYLKAMFRVYRVNHGFVRSFFMALRDASKPIPF